MIDKHGNRRFAHEHPDDAIRLLLDRLDALPHERVDLADAAGRVLAMDVLADRPSPPCDVSAMDGYALSRIPAPNETIPVKGEVRTGDAPPNLPDGSAVRLFTGGAIPSGAEAVIPREQTIEHPDRIRLREHVTVEPGQHIRRQGENAPLGAKIASAGDVVTTPMMAALAAFGAAQPCVHRTVRIGVLITGDELVAVDQEPEPWRIRDSNRWSLLAFIAALPWAELNRCVNVPDQPATLIEAMRAMLAECDAVLLTGGVSMGDHDHVAPALKTVGAEEVFHWLPIRPGKPMLGAISEIGTADHRPARQSGVGDDDVAPVRPAAAHEKRGDRQGARPDRDGDGAVAG